MFQIWFLDHFLMSMSSASEPGSSLISFAGSDSTLALSPQLRGVPRWVSLAGNLNKIGVRGGWHNYSSEAIILNISVKGGDYSRDGYYSRKYGIYSLLIYSLSCLIV